MSNMSYCRFENTANDLEDCFDNFEDNLEWSEFSSRKRIVELARQIIELYWEEEFEEEKFDD